MHANVGAHADEYRRVFLRLYADNARGPVTHSANLESSVKDMA